MASAMELDSTESVVVIPAPNVVPTEKTSFTVIKKIADGAFNIVYMAKNGDGEVVVLKQNLIESPVLPYEIVREFNIAADMARQPDPLICTAQKLFLGKQYMFTVMEYLDGDLQDVIDQLREVMHPDLNQMEQDSELAFKEECEKLAPVAEEDEEVEDTEESKDLPNDEATIVAHVVPMPEKIFVDPNQSLDTLEFASGTVVEFVHEPFVGGLSALLHSFTHQVDEKLAYSAEKLEKLDADREKILQETLFTHYKLVTRNSLHAPVKSLNKTSFKKFVMEMSKQIAQCALALERRGYLADDFRPANIGMRITEAGDIQLTAIDFGQVKRLNHHYDETVQVPHFPIAPPEIFHSEPIVNHAISTWQVGMCIGALLVPTEENFFGFDAEQFSGQEDDEFAPRMSCDLNLNHARWFQDACFARGITFAVNRTTGVNYEDDTIESSGEDIIEEERVLESKAPTEIAVVQTQAAEQIPSDPLAIASAIEQVPAEQISIEPIVIAEIPASLPTVAAIVVEDDDDLGEDLADAEIEDECEDDGELDDDGFNERYATIELDPSNIHLVINHMRTHRPYAALLDYWMLYWWLQFLVRDCMKRPRVAELLHQLDCPETKKIQAPKKSTKKNQPLVIPQEIELSAWEPQQHVHQSALAYVNFVPQEAPIVVPNACGIREGLIATETYLRDECSNLQQLLLSSELYLEAIARGELPAVRLYQACTLIADRAYGMHLGDVTVAASEVEECRQFVYRVLQKFEANGVDSGNRWYSQVHAAVVKAFYFKSLENVIPQIANERVKDWYNRYEVPVGFFEIWHRLTLFFVCRSLYRSTDPIVLTEFVQLAFQCASDIAEGNVSKTGLTESQIDWVCANEPLAEDCKVADQFT